MALNLYFGCHSCFLLNSKMYECYSLRLRKFIPIFYQSKSSQDLIHFLTQNMLHFDDKVAVLSIFSNLRSQVSSQFQQISTEVISFDTLSTFNAWINQLNKSNEGSSSLNSLQILEQIDKNYKYFKLKQLYYTTLINLKLNNLDKDNKERMSEPNQVFQKLKISIQRLKGQRDELNNQMAIDRNDLNNVEMAMNQLARQLDQRQSVVRDKQRKLMQIQKAINQTEKSYDIIVETTRKLSNALDHEANHLRSNLKR